MADRQPDRGDHQSENVDEPEDRCQREDEFRGLQLIEEGAKRRQQRPKHEDAACCAEGHRVNDPQPDQESNLFATHPVANVVEAI